MCLSYIGGKSKIAKSFIVPRMPKDIEVYVEPFSGMYWTFFGMDLDQYPNLKTIVYNEYDMKSEIFSNNFFSNYNFQLSPITSTKGISGKVTSKSVSLNIFKKNTIGGNILNQAEIKNCKKENSIDSLLKFLKNYLCTVRYV
jgi:hypothetical protein